MCDSTMYRAAVADTRVSHDHRSRSTPLSLGTTHRLENRVGPSAGRIDGANPSKRRRTPEDDDEDDDEDADAAGGALHNTSASASDADQLEREGHQAKRSNNGTQAKDWEKQVSLFPTTDNDTDKTMAAAYLADNLDDLPEICMECRAAPPPFPSNSNGDEGRPRTMYKSAWMGNRGKALHDIGDGVPHKANPPPKMTSAVTLPRLQQAPAPQ